MNIGGKKYQAKNGSKIWFKIQKEIISDLMRKKTGYFLEEIKGQMNNMYTKINDWYRGTELVQHSACRGVHIGARALPVT